MKVTQNYADRDDEGKIISTAVSAGFSIDDIRKTAHLMHSWMAYSLLQQEREVTLHSMLASLSEYARMSNL